MSDSVGTAILLTRSERYEPRVSFSAYSLRAGCCCWASRWGDGACDSTRIAYTTLWMWLRCFRSFGSSDFAAVDDAGRFTPAADPADYAQAEYACGCYEFTRPAS